MTETEKQGTDLPPLAEGALPPRLIVCERSGQWAVALRRELARGDVRVHETRGLAECWQMLARCPSSFVVAELTDANVEALLDRLASRRRLFPLVRVAVVSDRPQAAYEPLAREAGAVHFAASLREAGPVARLACRHLDQAARPRRSLTESIWAELPWATSDET